MPKPMNYAARRARESLPVVDGRQYRAEEVKVTDGNCEGCAAHRGGGVINKELCNALPPCTKSNRLDARSVRYVDCGKAVPK